MDVHCSSLLHVIIVEDGDSQQAISLLLPLDVIENFVVKVRSASMFTLQCLNAYNTFLYSRNLLSFLIGCTNGILVSIDYDKVRRVDIKHDRDSSPERKLFSRHGRIFGIPDDFEHLLTIKIFLW